MLEVATDAFGNALGSSLADYSSGNTAQESFRRGEIAQQNAQAAPVQGFGPWTAADYRSGSDIQGDEAYMQLQRETLYGSALVPIHLVLRQ
ncbi:MULTISPECIES: hypothetical protein [unclassified Acidovorax]|uniref:hypothetical protein n=1 Tax=unclassified Acidovorax TaxID=2684926 RepID=UPI00288345D8|nr:MULTISPECIES: hypothetical protein [unclassified Acidovorax]